MEVKPFGIKLEKLYVSPTLRQTFNDGTNFQVNKIHFDCTPILNFNYYPKHKRVTAFFDFHFNIDGFLEYRAKPIYYLTYPEDEIIDFKQVNDLMLNATYNYYEYFKDCEKELSLEMLLPIADLMPPERIVQIAHGVLNRLNNRG